MVPFLRNYIGTALVRECSLTHQENDCVWAGARIDIATNQRANKKAVKPLREFKGFLLSIFLPWGDSPLVCPSKDYFGEAALLA